MSAEKSDAKQPSKWSAVRFLAYWRANINTAKEHHEGLILLALIGWQFVYIGLKIVGINDVKYEVPHMDEIEHVSVYVFAAVALLWIPFRRHEASNKEFEGHFEAAVKRIEAHYENAIVAKDETLKLLMEKTKTLESLLSTAEEKLDDRQKKKKIVEQLGDYHIRLTNRLRKIKGMFYLEYCRLNENAFNEKRFDEETQLIVSEIEVFLLNNVGGSSKAIFCDKTNLKIERAGPQYPEFVEKENFHNAIIGNLACYADNLMKIITTYSADKH